MLHEDFKELLILLEKNEVEYLLVGGYAVSFYGYPRYTGDMDIWYNSNNENALKLINVLKQFGFATLNITIKDLTRQDSIIQLGYPPIRIDFINNIDGVEFTECYKNKLFENYDGLKIKIINIEDLKKNKKASGRFRDLDDLEHLIKIKK